MARHPNIVQKWKYQEDNANKNSGNPEDNRMNINKNNRNAPPGERLEELKNSEYQIADHQPEITNWVVVDANGKEVGIVQDFLFDKDALKVRYIIINLKEGQIIKENKNILIPIGKAVLQREEERILIPAINKEKLLKLPQYRSTKSLAREDEKITQQMFSDLEMQEDNDKKEVSKDFYTHEDFNEDNFYKE